MSAGINYFLSQVSRQGGFSFTNNFLVEFKKGAQKYFNGDLVEIFCEEVQLPNSNTATGTQNGLLTGLGSVDYPHTRVYTEFALTFMLDANLSMLKSLNNWYYDVIGGGSDNTIRMGGNPPSPYRTLRVRYKTQYQGDIHISKTELGKTSSTGRKAITYVMENAWPYQIDAVPLQFGSSQITKVTANFKYERHYTMTDDIKNSPQMSEGEANNKQLINGVEYTTLPASPDSEKTKLEAFTKFKKSNAPLPPVSDKEKLEAFKNQVEVLGNRNLKRRMINALGIGE